MLKETIATKVIAEMRKKYNFFRFNCSCLESFPPLCWQIVFFHWKYSRNESIQRDYSHVLLGFHHSTNKSSGIFCLLIIRRNQCQAAL